MVPLGIVALERLELVGILARQDTLVLQGLLDIRERLDILELVNRGLQDIVVFQDIVVIVKYH